MVSDTLIPSVLIAAMIVFSILTIFGFYQFQVCAHLSFASGFEYFHFCVPVKSSFFCGERPSQASLGNFSDPIIRFSIAIILVSAQLVWLSYGVWRSSESGVLFG